MKRIFSVFLAFALLFALSFTTALAKNDNANGNGGQKENNGNNGEKSSATAQPEESDAGESDAGESDTGESDAGESETDEASDQGKNKSKNTFKAQLNEQKRELQNQKDALCQQLDQLEAEYEELADSGDTKRQKPCLRKLTALRKKSMRFNRNQADDQRTIYGRQNDVFGRRAPSI
jgi:hypothetical protein